MTSMNTVAENNLAIENNSGQGKVDEIPDGVEGWSWGACLLTWVWAIGNNTWVGLLALLPYVGLVMSIILGYKGRKWAWQNKKWQSVEHFQDVQRKWTLWGIVFSVVSLVVGIWIFFQMPSMFGNYPGI
jgi:hypothetical protein